jgi:ketosteroid isomerase-like protein
MSEQVSVNLERMRRGYEAIGRGDIDEVLLEMLDPEVEIRDRPEIPDPGVYKGFEGAQRSLATTEETFDSWALTPERFVEHGDSIVVVLHLEGRGRESGVPVEDRLAHLWTMRDGKGYRMQVYSDPEEAIAEAQARAARAAGADNVALVRSAYEAFQAGEIERAMPLLDPAIEWVEPPEAPESGTWRGREGAISSTDNWTSGWSDYELQLVELVPKGERVLVCARQRGRGERSGVVIEGDIFHVWTLRDGRAVRMEMYTDARVAREAAGLDPDGRER